MFSLAKNFTAKKTSTIDKKILMTKQLCEMSETEVRS